MYSPAAIEKAPPSSPARPARRTKLPPAEAPAMPRTSEVFETSPSLTPKTAARAPPPEMSRWWRSSVEGDAVTASGLAEPGGPWARLSARGPRLHSARAYGGRTASRTGPRKGVRATGRAVPALLRRREPRLRRPPAGGRRRPRPRAGGALGGPPPRRGGRRVRRHRRDDDGGRPRRPRRGARHWALVVLGPKGGEGARPAAADRRCLPSPGHAGGRHGGHRLDGALALRGDGRRRRDRRRDRGRRHPVVPGRGGGASLQRARGALRPPAHLPGPRHRAARLRAAGHSVPGR